METTAHIALSRQMARRRHMDVIANNIANMTASGFKAEALMYEPVVSDAGSGQRLAFVQDVGVARDLRAGPMTSTGNPLDLAIEGPGYFALETDQGTRYGRSGQFRLSESGELVTAAGDPVLDDGGAPLTLPLDPGRSRSLPTVPCRPGRAWSAGSDWSSSPTSSGCARWAADSIGPTSRPRRPERSRVVQGMLQGSNVEPILAMTEMMAIVRAYQGMQRLLDTHHELQRRAIERVLEAST